jgi:hypothetical protein
MLTHIHTHRSTASLINPLQSSPTSSSWFVLCISLLRKFDPTRVYSYHRISLQTQRKIEPASKTLDLQTWVLSATALTQSITCQIHFLFYRQACEGSSYVWWTLYHQRGNKCSMYDCWSGVGERMGGWWIGGRNEKWGSYDKETENGYGHRKKMFWNDILILTSMRIRVGKNNSVTMETFLFDSIGREENPKEHEEEAWKA